MIRIADAVPENVDAMLRVTAKPPTLHLDRITSARAGTWLRYLVVFHGDDLCGFGCLFLSKPPDKPDLDPVPQLIDLNIRPDKRGQGLGSALIQTMVRIAKEDGLKRIYISPDLSGNPRTLGLYERLGFVVSSEPYWEDWSYVDTAGRVHGGGYWTLRMTMDLSQGKP